MPLHTAKTKYSLARTQKNGTPIPLQKDSNSTPQYTPKRRGKWRRGARPCACLGRKPGTGLPSLFAAQVMCWIGKSDAGTHEKEAPQTNLQRQQVREILVGKGHSLSLLSEQRKQSRRPNAGMKASDLASRPSLSSANGPVAEVWFGPRQ